MQRFIGDLAGVLVLVVTLAGTSTPAGAAPAANREQRVVVTVTKNGFESAAVRLKAGRPVRLVVTRTVERTCATEIVLKQHGISKPLPLNKPVEVRFTPRKAGTIRYACAMDMIAGELVVE
jgi:plastocyanin domain-containing protein